MPVYKLKEDNQPGYWYYLDMPLKEVQELRGWLQKNFGNTTRMKGTIATGWVPEHSDRKWTIMADIQRSRSALIGLRNPKYLVFWQKEAAALFVLYYTPSDNFPDRDFS